MTETVTEAKPGGRMPDGTIYAGISPDTGKPIYTTAEDGRELVSHETARSITEAMADHSGHNNGRLPTIRELNVLFKAQAAIGGFHDQTYGGPRCSPVALGQGGLVAVVREREQNEGAPGTAPLFAACVRIGGRLRGRTSFSVPAGGVDRDFAGAQGPGAL